MTSVAYYDRSIPKLLRWLGCFEASRTLVRFRWGEVSPRWGLGMSLCSFEDNWSLCVLPFFGQWFLKLPRWLPHREPREILDKWGFSWSWFDPDGSTIHLNWGDRSKVFFMPWRWRHHSSEILRTDGTWRLQKCIRLLGGGKTNEYDSSHTPLPDVYVEQHPYHYLLDSGETQHVTATISVTRSEWRIIKWLPWPRKRHRYIDISFDGEVGERAGSWKGGCVGCAYEMRPGEQPRDTLRRMQRVRRFR